MNTDKHATYRTREGETWELCDLRAHAFLSGFWWARRLGDQNLVCVHEQRMTFLAPAATTPQESTPTETSNPS